MKNVNRVALSKGSRLGTAVLVGLLFLFGLIYILNVNTPTVKADPIPPDMGGYPKFNVSILSVTPTLAHTGGITLYYTIELRNTGAFTAEGTTVVDSFPQGTTYPGDAQSDVFNCSASLSTLTCLGDIGFDSSAVITFSLWVNPAFSGTLQNTAVISHPLMAKPVIKTAETVITDIPILTIEKSAVPVKPGPGKPLTYTLTVGNRGQPATDLLVTVVDHVPLNTSLISTGTDGIASPAHDLVTWTRHITLDPGEMTTFDFAVEVGPVPSGTIISNEDYWVSSAETKLTIGDPYTVTVVSPIFALLKEIWPDPPGSNREMTYKLTVLNTGSLATNLVITDVVPTGVDDPTGTYPHPTEMVSWSYPNLDTNESAEFTFTVYISDVMNVPIVNQDYGVCSAEGVCLMGDVLTSVVRGPTFETFVWHDPIAKKPGGGGGPVTPTLMVRNMGPGNGLDVEATVYFTRISVSANDLYAIPDDIGTKPPFPDGPDCGSKCVSYVWVGDLYVGDVVTFTTKEGQSTIGGEEETIYTSTVVVSDSLANTSTTPLIGSANGRVTKHAYLIPTKRAPSIVGLGELVTYTIKIWNSALSTDEPPYPFLFDSVPMSTTVVRISDNGISHTLTGTTFVSWTLPAISTGAELYRSYTVRIDDDLFSGTQIINSDYWVYWHEAEITTTMYLSNTGKPVTTTVREVGLIDSYKAVTPTLTIPGPGQVLTFFVHIINSGPHSLDDVTLYDLLPWESSTYLRDAIASAGEVVSDIVSIQWTGSVEAFSSEVLTLTVLVDDDFQGAITNTAIISHADLEQEIVVEAVAYVTDKPIFEIVKQASPDPVERGAELGYKITVMNLGQRATGLVITDSIPINTIYVPNSANYMGELVGNELQWNIPTLDTGESRTCRFRVTVGGERQVVNKFYGVRGTGVLEMGRPLYTDIARGEGVYLPLVVKQ